MAKVTKLMVLNPADKTRLYSVAIGEGAPTDADDPVNADVKTYPVGSQYTDVKNKKFYVRTAATGVAGDWSAVGAGA